MIRTTGADDLVLIRARTIRRLGSQVAFTGVVEGVGRDASRFHPGDQVQGVTDRAFGEYLCAHAADIELTTTITSGE